MKPHLDARPRLNPSPLSGSMDPKAASDTPDCSWPRSRAQMMINRILFIPYSIGPVAIPGSVAGHRWTASRLDVGGGGNVVTTRITCELCIGSNVHGTLFHHQITSSRLADLANFVFPQPAAFFSPLLRPALCPLPVSSFYDEAP